MNRSRVIVERSVRWRPVPARGASVISKVVLRRSLAGYLLCSATGMIPLLVVN